MAIVSISKIQIRRGRANSGTGLPQLSSGEMAWAIDTKELFIGNGAVSEGAPFVGNTRVLTEDDIQTMNSSTAGIFGQLDYVYKDSGAIKSINIINQGLGYTDGTYPNTALTWVSYGEQPIILPVATIVVQGGVVTVVEIVYAGSGISIGAHFTVSGTLIGDGSDFLLGVTNVTGPNIPIIDTVTRTIQERLDDRTNVFNFGAKGDGITDDTHAIQNAIDQLYLNSPSASTTTSERVILEIPAGTYRLTNTLYVPSYATIIGAGKHNTILEYNPIVVISGTTVYASDIITTHDATNLMLNAIVTGPGIPADTIVSAVVPGISLVLSNTSTSTSASVQSFTLDLTPTVAIIKFVNDLSLPGNYTTIGSSTLTNQPRNITMKDLTVQTTSAIQGGLQLDAVRDSIFENIAIVGNWAHVFNTNNFGLGLYAQSTEVTCIGNVFKNIYITGFGYGIYATQDIIGNTFSIGLIDDVQHGFVFGFASDGITDGQVYGPRDTKISEYRFNNIQHHGVFITRGSGNSISDCSMENVGNNGGGYLTALYPQIYFNTYNNIVENINSDRYLSLSSPLVTIPYYPEFSGHGRYNQFGTHSLPIVQEMSYTNLVKLPISTTENGVPVGSISYKIEYQYNSGIFIRNGVLSIICDINSALVKLTDTYDYVGDVSATVAVFDVVMLDINGDITFATPYSLCLQYINTSSNTGNIILNYSNII